MSRRVELLFVVVIGLLMSSFQAIKAQTPVPPPREETDVKQLVQQLQEAWNAHDAKAFAAPFAADADYVVINGTKIKGREEIEKGHAGIFATIYKDSHNVATIRGIRFLRQDVAIIHVEWNLEHSLDGERRKSRAMNTIVATKENGKWSTVAFHNTPIQETPR